MVTVPDALLGVITVFAPISAPGAFEIEIQHCQFALQLAPPFTIKNIWFFNLFFNILLFLGKNILQFIYCIQNFVPPL